MKEAVVRYYFDEDILGLANVVCGLRADATFPGDLGTTIHKQVRPACPIGRGTKDPIWVPEVARRGWLIITRDFNIRQNPAERRSVRENMAKMVALAGEDARGTWSQLELLMKHWRRIEELALQGGPFIYRLSKSGARAVDVSGA